MTVSMREYEEPAHRGLAAKARLQVRKARWQLVRTHLRFFRRGITFGSHLQVAPRASFITQPGDRISIGDRCRIGQGAIIATQGGWVEIGDQCTIQPYAILYGHGGLRIGDYVRIAAHTVLIPADHRFEDLDRPIAEQGETRQGIVVEDDVWIGANVTILDGCTVGSGAVIAAGAVVTRSVPPRAVVAGCPARVMRWRGERRE